MLGKINNYQIISRVILFVFQDDIDSSSKVMLELFQLTCEELNVMIFPVLDFFEVRDWIANHFKVHNSEIFKNLKGIRNDVNFTFN
jgi:hypothetical protein